MFDRHGVLLTTPLATSVLLEVRVALAKAHSELLPVQPLVAQHVQPVTNIDNVDQPVLYDRGAPHLDGISAEPGVFYCHRWERLGPELGEPRRVRWIRNVDRLEPSRVPRHQCEIVRHR